MKILMVTNDYPNHYYIGGQGVVVQQIAQRMVSRGHLVRILDADRDHNTGWNILPVHEFDDSVEIYRLGAYPFPIQIGKFSLLPPVLRVHSIIKSASHFLWADVVHFHNFWGTGFLMPLFYVASVLRKRYVFTPYYEDYETIDPAHSYSYEKLLRLFCARAAKVTALSKTEGGILSRFTHNMVISPLGIDPKEFEDIRSEPKAEKQHVPLILAVGTMCLRKNYIALVDALAKITQPWKLIIVASQIADTAYYEKFKEVCLRVGVRDRVEVKINIERHKLLEMYRSADLFVMPSLWESFGIAAAEAMACGIPTILSSNSLIIDFLKDGENSVIVNARDESGIAQKIKTLLDDPKKALAIGNEGRQLIRKNFTWESVATNFENIYTQAIG